MKRHVVIRSGPRTDGSECTHTGEKLIQTNEGWFHYAMNSAPVPGARNWIPDPVLEGGGSDAG